GRLLATLQGQTGGVRGVTLSADGRLLASGSWDGTSRLWEARSGRPLGTLRGHTSGVWGVAMNAEGRLLASGGEDGTVRLWEAPFAENEGDEASARRSADSGQSPAGSSNGNSRNRGEQLASRRADTGDSRATASNGGRLLATLHGHTSGVWGV